MQYKEQHIANKLKLHGKMNPTSLTVHSTANPKSTAQNERDNLNRAGNTTSTGFHVVVDDKQAIECIPLDRIAHHAGNKAGNETSVGMEICESGNRQKTLDNAVRVTAKILRQHGWGTDKLKRHFDWSGKNCPRILNYNNWQGWTKFKEDVKKELLKKETPKTANYYRVRKSWTDSKSQLGAFSNLQNAIDLATKNKGYKVFDSTGKQVFTEAVKAPKKANNEFLVKVTASALNVRSGPGTKNKINGTIRDKGTYTIVDTNGSWGRLKSGAGWISLKYTKRV